MKFDQFHLMQVFVAVAEEEGFAAAARRLNLSAPAVTRAIAALEQRLGVSLLRRTTRFVRATEVGRRYLDDARRILRELELANEAATGVNAEPTGHLSITAPVLFGEKFVLPSVFDYLNTYPSTQIDAVFVDRIVNLLEEGFDLGVRIGHLPDSSMQAKRVGTVRLMLVASPSYLEKAKVLLKPEDLKHHSLVGTKAGSLPVDWQFKLQGENKNLTLHSRLQVSTNQAAISAAVSGLGITRIISYQVADLIASGVLKSVLEDFEVAPIPVHIIHREGRLSSRKVRVFIDLLANKLQNDKALNTEQTLQH